MAWEPRKLHSKIEVSDPDVSIAIRADRSNPEEQEKWGATPVGTFNIEEAEQLIDLLDAEVNRAKKVRAALGKGPHDGSL